MPLGDRDDQPEVGPDDLVLDGQCLFLKPFDLVEVGGLGPGGIDLRADLLRQMLEVIHLAEQVHFLLAVQQRNLVEAGQVRRQAPWGPWAAAEALPSAGSGMGPRISGARAGIGEASGGR